MSCVKFGAFSRQNGLYIFPQTNSLKGENIINYQRQAFKEKEKYSNNNFQSIRLFDFLLKNK